MLQIGDLKIRVVSGGRFRLDGGAMFGVVPRPLWSQKTPVDELNRIPLATNCLLVERGDQKLLIDTGLGTQLSEKAQEFNAFEEDGSLVGNLESLGVAATDIQVVLFSHLHFDHSSGATRRDESGAIVPAFENARYVTQRKEWETAMDRSPEWKGVYMQEMLEPLKLADQLELIDGDAEVLPGIRVELTGGHSVGHHVVILEDQGQQAMYLGDLCPTWNHLTPAWCMAYDVDPMESRRQKMELLGRLADESGWALSDHDPSRPMVRLQRDSRRGFVVAD